MHILKSPVAVLDEKIWGYGPMASKCLPGIDARSADSGGEVLGEGPDRKRILGVFTAQKTHLLKM